MFTKFLAFTGFVLIGLGCSPAPGPSSPKSGVEAFQNLDSPTLRSSQLGLFGQGRLIFTQPLSGINSREHYVIEASDWQDGGSFVLHSHLNSFNAVDGTQVEALRQGEDIQFSLSTPGYPLRRIFLMESAFTHADRIRLRLEVHDGGAEGVRLLVWQDSISHQGELMTKLPFVSAGNAAFDSREEKLVSQSHGRGIRWGLQLNQLTLLQAFREVPYVE